MAFFEEDLRQTAVYWGSPAVDGYGGPTSFADPEEIPCRWEVKQELFIDDTAREQRSRAVVYLARPVEIGGYMYLGELSELDSDPSPLDVKKAFRVSGIEEIADVDGEEFLYKAWLGVGARF